MFLIFRESLAEDYTFGYPSHFDIIGAESDACRSRAALFNMSYFGKFYLSGPDAQVRVKPGDLMMFLDHVIILQYYDNT